MNRRKFLTILGCAAPLVAAAKVLAGKPSPEPETGYNYWTEDELCELSQNPITFGWADGGSEWTVCPTATANLNCETMTLNYV